MIPSRLWSLTIREREMPSTVGFRQSFLAFFLCLPPAGLTADEIGSNTSRDNVLESIREIGIQSTCAAAGVGAAQLCGGMVLPKTAASCGIGTAVTCGQLLPKATEQIGESLGDSVYDLVNSYRQRRQGHVREYDINFRESTEARSIDLEVFSQRGDPTYRLLTDVNRLMIEKLQDKHLPE